MSKFLSAKKRSYYINFILLAIICIAIFLSEKNNQSKNQILQEVENILLDTSYILDRAGIEEEINWHKLDYKTLNQLIDEKNIAGYCGLAATFMARKLNEKKFNSLTLNVGVYRDDVSKYSSHVLTLVKVNEKFYVFDLFLGTTIVDKNNNYIDLFTALDNSNKYFFKNIISQDKKSKKHFVITNINTDPSCNKKIIKNKNVYICEQSQKKLFDLTVSDWINDKNNSIPLYWDYKVGEDIVLSLIKQGIFNIAEYKDKKDFITLTTEFTKRGIRLYNSVFD